MTTAATSLLDFILSLFTDEAAAARYQANPEGELARAGLHGVSPADVDAVTAMETDFAPVSASGDACGDDKGDDKGHHHGAPVHHEDKDDDHGDHGHGRWNDNHGGHETAVIQHVENSYNTTTTTEIEIEHAVWAGGDAYAIWGDDVVIATGGSVAAGDDVEDVSVDNRVDIDVADSFNDNSTDVEGVGNAVGAGAEVEDSFNTDIDVENSGNTQHGTGNVVGEENAVDNSEDNSVEVDLENSLNQIDGNSNNIGEDNESHDESTDVDVEVEVEDSFNTDNSIDAEFEDSFNTDNSTNIDAEFEDSLNTDNSTEIEESFNDNAIAVDEAIANTGDVDVDA